jgi:beta-lactamase regulating signal transducer with metallopeptidase domain
MSGAWANFQTWLIHSAVGGSLLLLFVWTLMKRCRQPARQERLGEWGLVAVLVLAFLSTGPAWLVVPLLEVAPTPERAVPTLPSAAALVERQQSEVNPDERAPLLPEALFSVPTFPDPGPDLIELRPSNEDAFSTGALPQPALPQAELLVNYPATSAFSLDNSMQWLGFAYLSVFGLLAARLLIGHIGLWRLLRRAQPAPETALDLFHEMARDFRRCPRLLVSNRLRVPVSCGLITPTVIVPAGLCQVNARRTLRWVLAHELTHLERRDAWACLLFGLGQVIYFYLPWFWWLRRQVRLCQEYIADAAAVEQAADPEGYAKFLLHLSTGPAIPLGATGVTGNSSDLFRRLSMLLQDRMQVEKRCPRWWSLAAAGALLTLAVVASGISLRASPAEALPGYADTARDTVSNPDDPKPAPKQDALAKKTKLEPFDVMREQDMPLPQLDPERVLGPQQPFFGGGFRSLQQEGRLGIRVQKPDATLVEQLELPKGEGLVVEHVQAGAAAAKAGLKAHDILLEFNGKPVADDPGKLVRAVNDLKADTTVDAVVLRKGKKETIKGITLPERKAVAPVQNFFPGQAPRFGGGPGQQGLPLMQPGGQLPALGQMMPGFPGFPPQGRQAGGVLTTNFRVENRFTTRHQEGSLIITVTGTVADDKVKVSHIQIQDGRESNKYESVAEVPDQYRDKVNNLVEINEKSNIKIEIKTPPEDKKVPEKKH